MLPTSKRTSEEQVLIDSGKESASLDYDNSSYFPSPSSCYERDSVDFRSTNGFNRDAINNNKYAVPSTYLRSFSHSSKSSQSSGYESSWIKPPPLISHSIFKDPSSSFDSMLSPFKSFTSNDEASNFTQSSQSSDSVSYSPLSSFNFAEHKLPADFYSDLNFDGEPWHDMFHDRLVLHFCILFTDLSSPLQAENQAFHDALRHDFEMNGKTVDVEATSTFSPMISSTPMTNRKSHQGQLQDKENSQQRLNQQSSPNQEWSKNKRNHKRRFKPNKKSLEDVRLKLISDR